MIAAANHWPYVIASWTVATGVIGGYTAWLITKGRALSRQVPPEDRRWL